MTLKNTSILDTTSKHDSSLIYVWRKRLLFVGPSIKARTRKYVPCYLMFCLDGPLKITVKGELDALECRMVLVPASTEITCHNENQSLAVLYLDYFNEDFEALQMKANSKYGPIYWDFEENIESYCLTVLHELNKHQLGIDAADGLITALHLRLHRFDNFCDVGDERLKRIIGLMVMGKLGKNYKISDAADAVGLSVPRVVQLFKKSFNMTFKEFRNKFKMHIFVISIAMGRSHSQAAQDAGYVDSSHFCKHFKAQTGIQASNFFGPDLKTKFFVEESVKDYFGQTIYKESPAEVCSSVASVS
ncbi:helix-turn-helix domain-containing protein [Aurantivibrio plasticivorans]